MQRIEMPHRSQGAGARRCPGSGLAIIVTVIVVTGCTGQVGTTGGVTGAGGDTSTAGRAGTNGEGPLPVAPDNANPALSACRVADTGASRLLRVTRFQYDNSVADLLGDTTGPSTALASDERPGTFAVNADAALTDTLYVQYVEVAEAVAARAKPQFGKLAPCDETKQGGPACAAVFAKTLGRRLYRRPLLSSEIDRFTKLYADNAMAGHASALELILTTLLQSPNFLYQFENGRQVSGSDPGVARLDGFSVATRMAFFLWQAAPDDELLAAAESGSLDTTTGIEAQARRMLDVSKTKRSWSSFFGQWLQVARMDQTILDIPLRKSLKTEFDSFIENLRSSGDASVATLLSSREANLDSTSSAFYGGTALNPSQRAGLLTRAAFLAANTAVPARGKFVFNELLCNSIALPDDVDTTLKDRQPGENPRAQFERHSEDAQCHSCHRYLDPLGDAFWHYDKGGRWRDAIDGWTVDARVVVEDVDAAVDGPSNGAVELSTKLAKSETVQTCFARQWFRFAMGRDADDTRDECSLAVLQQSLDSSGGTIDPLLSALTTTNAFRHIRTTP